MTTLRKKRKLAALNKVNKEEHRRRIQARYTNVPRSQEEYITHVSEEIEGGVTKKLCNDFSATESCILAALSQLDEFFLNPLTQGRYGSTPEASQNEYGTNQGKNEDDS